MPRCPACSTEVSADSRFCNSCGAPVSRPAAAEETPTEYMPAADSHPSSAAPVDEERFPPGTVIAGRYRVAGMLGRGGMGEVYRATDLVLRQQVALKFLPPAIGAAQPAIERFLNEVRIARQISHPNVCRVYDIGMYEGSQYISMEYVDGEDLSSLLRRIGRLPQDKALEFARRICAGLAAAHDKGVLHRDLKPANIMIDGRGQAVIMDFGLAGLSGQFQGAEIRSGTPGYMAPEQLAGAEVTERSDVYSLGCVLYEMFTGKRPFEAKTMAELSRMQSQAQIAMAGTLVKDLDPAVERVILRCLDPDPARRPASALAVAAALPGGDPLAAALAAGETPSPEMVAAAGASEGGSPKFALIALLITLLWAVGGAAISGKLALVARTPFDNSPEALAGRAREILKTLGYAERPVDTAHWFAYDQDYLAYLSDPKRAAGRCDAIWAGQPAPISFTYRTSPDWMVTSNLFAGLHPSVVNNGDPALDEPGMKRLTLDAQGRLLELQVVTPRHENPPGKPAPYDWKVLFTAAGFDMAKFAPEEPEWLPLTSVDTRAAWTGKYADGTALRIEAGAFRGRPVFFKMVGPWVHAPGEKRPERSARHKAGNVTAITLFLAAVAFGCGLARRHIKMQRGDARGAVRIGMFVFLAMMTAWVFGASHIPTLAELMEVILAVSWALFFAVLAWMLYLALEPYARRHWPQTLVSWSRLLAGGFRDPLVGREALVGLACGAALTLSTLLRQYAEERYGVDPQAQDLLPLLGIRHLTAGMVARVPIAIAAALGVFFLMLGMRTLLRKQWLASIGFVIVLAAQRVLLSPTPAIDAAFTMAGLVVLQLVLLRFGLLAVVMAILVQNWLLAFPLTLDVSAWHFGLWMFLLAVVAGIALYAFRLVVAGRPLLLKD